MLRSKSMPRATITIRPYQAGDEHAILATFNRVFARADPAFVPRTIEHWRWLYERNPCGTRVMLAVEDGGEVLAQYAGLPVRARLAGRDAVFCQAVDSMSARDERPGLARRGLFGACCEAFRAAWSKDGGAEGAVEDGRKRHVLVYGLPAPSAWRVGRAQLGYGLLREGFVHVLDVDRAILTDAEAIEVRDVERFGAETDELFARIAPNHDAIVVRDARYLNWRFADAPARPYEAAIACSGGRAAGLAVWRSGTFEGEAGGLVCEWMVPAEERGASLALHAWLVRRTLSSGRTHLFATAAPHSRAWIELQERGFRVRRARNVWAAHSHSRAHPLRWLARNFHVTFSDTDLA
jgi:hypothetical protein